MQCRRLYVSMNIVLVIAISLFSTACSFVFAKGPPAHHQELATVECTDGKTLPTLDVIYTLLQVVRTGAALAASDEDYADASLGRGADIGLGIVLGGVGLASVVYGSNVVSECRRAKGEAAERANAQSQIGWMPTQRPATSAR